MKAANLLNQNKLFSQSLNRSYYSIFHSVRALFAYEGIDFKKHSALIAYFNKNYIKTEKLDREYSKIIMKAEKIRNKSVYNDFFIISAEDAREQFKDAEKFIDAIEDFILNNYSDKN